MRGGSVALKGEGRGGGLLLPRALPPATRTALPLSGEAIHAGYEERPLALAADRAIIRPA